MEKNKVCTVVTFFRRPKTGALSGTLDWVADLRELPAGADIVAVMDHSRRTIFYPGNDADTREEDDVCTVGQFMDGAISKIQKRVNPEFGRRISPAQQAAAYALWCLRQETGWHARAACDRLSKLIPGSRRLPRKFEIGDDLPALDEPGEDTGPLAI